MTSSPTNAPFRLGTAATLSKSPARDTTTGVPAAELLSMPTRRAVYTHRSADAPVQVSLQSLQARINGALRGDAFDVVTGGALAAPLQIHGDITVRFMCGSICVSRADVAAVTVSGGATVEGLHASNPSGTAIAIDGGLSTIRGCTAEASVDGFVMADDCGSTVTGCVARKCTHGMRVTLDKNARRTPVVEGCTFEKNKHGLIVECGAPWITRCTMHSNQGCGVSFGESASGVLHECVIANNSTQGVYIETKAWGPIGTPVLAHCHVHGGQASGVKITQKSSGHVYKCMFESNADHDIDVETFGTATIADCRFAGGSNAGVVFWDSSRGSLHRCTFAPYGLWACIVHEKSTLDMINNIFTSSAACSVAGSPAARRHRVTTWAAGADDKGSGLLLNEKVRGTASNNVFLGWVPGFTDGRCAFCLVKCGAFRNDGANVIASEILAAQPEGLRSAIVAVASNDPEGRVVDLRRVSLARTSAAPASSSTTTAVSTPGIPMAPLPEEGIALLCDLMAVSSSTTHLDLGGSGLSDMGAHHVSRAIAGHPSLCQVSIADNPSITIDGFSAFASAVASAPLLENVDVSGLRMPNNEEAMLRMATHAVEMNPRIKRFAVDEQCKRSARVMSDELDFMCSVNTHATTPDARSTMLAVRHNDPSVVSLDFNGQNLCVDDEQAVTIAAYSLKSNTCVAKLTLDARVLTPSMLRPLSDLVLRGASSLTSLSLRDAGIEDVTPLATALTSSSNRRLTALDLSGNRLSRRQNADALASLFRETRTAVRRLDVSRNHFDPFDIDFLVASVPLANQGIVEIRTEGNDGVGLDASAIATDGCVGNDASTPMAPPTAATKTFRVQQPHKLRS